MRSAMTANRDNWKLGRALRGRAAAAPGNGGPTAMSWRSSPASSLRRVPPPEGPRRLAAGAGGARGLRRRTAPPPSHRRDGNGGLQPPSTTPWNATEVPADRNIAPQSTSSVTIFRPSIRHFHGLADRQSGSADAAALMAIHRGPILFGLLIVQAGCTRRPPPHYSPDRRHLAVISYALQGALGDDYEPSVSVDVGFHGRL
jgi:hypothetical protein